MALCTGHFAQKNHTVLVLSLLKSTAPAILFYLPQVRLNDPLYSGIHAIGITA